MHLDVEGAAAVIEERIGGPLGLDAHEAAMAINRVVTDSMAEAARIHSVEMNVDIRRLPLIAFGGPARSTRTGSRSGSARRP